MSDVTGHFIFKSRAQQAVEARFGEPVDVLLTRLYNEERLTQEEIATRLGVSRSAVIRWFTQYGLVGRHPRDFNGEAA